MLQGLFSPNTELLPTMENNLPASHLWSLPNQGHSDYQAAAMEAILSDGSLGLVSEHQALVNYGILTNPSISERMDETQILPPSSIPVNPGISSRFYTDLNDSNSIASLTAYPCSIVEKKSEIHEYTAYIDHGTMGMFTRTDPIINIRTKNSIQESLSSGSVAGMRAEDHGHCMGNSMHRSLNMPIGSCAKWRKGAAVSESQEKSSNVSHHEWIKDELNAHENIHTFNGQSGSSSNLYKDKASHDDSKEKDLGFCLSSSHLASYHSRKRPGTVADLPSVSTSYSKRAHLQNSLPLSVSASSTTTRTSTTTRSSKSSSRNPQGPALNTNGRPRAMQGSANDPQSVAARNRRERINGRLKVLQELVPNGSKVDLVTMLEKAINYVKFLQLQLTVLSNDDYWQESQENGEQATTRSEEGYSAHINAACNSSIACKQRQSWQEEI